MKKIITVIAVIALLAVLGVVLCACVPSDLDKAQKKLEKAGYKVEKTESKQIPGVVGEIYAYSEDGKDYIYAYLFDKKASAKAAQTALETTAKLDYDNAKVVRKGKWVYFGTDAAVKAFK